MQKSCHYYSGDKTKIIKVIEGVVTAHKLHLAR